MTFFFLFLFLIWTIFKVFIEFVTVLLLFSLMFWFFGHEACGILVPPPGIKPAPPALEEVLTTGPQGSPYGLFLNEKNKLQGS